MTEIELLPCSFCGGEARPTAHFEYSWFAPVCNSCGVRGPTVRIERGADPQKLRELMNKSDELWNRRHAVNKLCEKGRLLDPQERQPISVDIAQFARSLANRAQEISDLVDDKLSPVMTSARLPSDDVRDNDTMEYPPLFSDLRESLLNIEAALNSIVYAMSRTEI